MDLFTFDDELKKNDNIIFNCVRAPCSGYISNPCTKLRRRSHAASALTFKMTSKKSS